LREVERIDNIYAEATQYQCSSSSTTACLTIFPVWCLVNQERLDFSSVQPPGFRMGDTRWDGENEGQAKPSKCSIIKGPPVVNNIVFNEACGELRQYLDVATSLSC
jgi:hypothetical protein